MTNRHRARICPGLSEITVRDLLKCVSGTYRNCCPGLRETRTVFDKRMLRGEPGIESVDRRVFIFGVDFLNKADPSHPSLPDKVAVHSGDALEHLVDFAVQLGGLELLHGMIAIH